MVIKIKTLTRPQKEKKKAIKPTDINARNGANLQSLKWLCREILNYILLFF